MKEANCTANGYNTSVNWINTESIGEIRAIWDAWYDNAPLLPGNPPVDYIVGAPLTIGVTKASFNITILETGQSKFSRTCFLTFNMGLMKKKL